MTLSLPWRIAAPPSSCPWRTAGRWVASKSCLLLGWPHALGALELGGPAAKSICKQGLGRSGDPRPGRCQRPARSAKRLFFGRIARRRGVKIARVAVARRLLTPAPTRFATGPAAGPSRSADEPPEGVAQARSSTVTRRLASTLAAGLSFSRVVGAQGVGLLASPARV